MPGGGPGQRPPRARSSTASSRFRVSRGRRRRWCWLPASRHAAGMCCTPNEVLDVISNATTTSRSWAPSPAATRRSAPEADGKVTVELAGDHPGVTDPAYRARRDHLAGLAAAWRAGPALPAPDYTEEEHSVWRDGERLAGGPARAFACRAFLDGKDGAPAAGRPGAAADRGEWSVGAGGTDSVTSRSPGWRRCGTSTGRSRAGCSGRPSTSATRRCPCTPPSRTSSTR